MIIGKERQKEILRFLVVGGGCFLIEYALLYFLTEAIHIYYLYSAAIAFIVSVLINYWLCVKYVFAVKGKQNTKQASLFIGSSIGGLGINQLCMWFLVEKCGIYYMLAKIVAAAVVMIWNYFLKRKAVKGF
jgi:putative flippase GtrA